MVMVMVMVIVAMVMVMMISDRSIGCGGLELLVGEGEAPPQHTLQHPWGPTCIYSMGHCFYILQLKISTLGKRGTQVLPLNE